MIRIGIIGFGGIAQSAHLKPHLELEAKGISKLIAVCDICPERFDEKMEINIGGAEVSLGADVKKYTDWRRMLENEELDMVDICVPTYLHADIAIEALETGHHVLCEKPMSLNYELCKKMCETAKRVGKKLMIAQCCRFSPAYLYLKELVANNTYGKIKSGVFSRASMQPVWGWDNWFLDYKRSSGVILDMHIHDIDFIRYAFGEPKSVSCSTSDIYSQKDIAHSRLMYDDFSLLAIGDWSREGTEFESYFIIAFEHATVKSIGYDVTVYPRGGEAFSPELDDVDIYQAEIEYFIDCIENNKENITNSPEDSALSVKLVKALIESSDKNGEFVEFCAE